MHNIAIVGCGLTGSVIARVLAESGLLVTIYESRDHIGGNCYDRSEFNSFTHVYGPHLFHTSSNRVFEFISRFAEFAPYSHRVTAQVDGALVPIPYSLESLNYTHPSYLITRLCQKLVSEYGFGSTVSVFSLLDSPDTDIKSLGDYIFEKIFKGYSCKQWGVTDPLSLDPGVLNRVPVRISKDTRYFTDKYQFLPVKGYTSLVASILDHANIHVNLSVDLAIDPASLSGQEFSWEGNSYSHIFYTGPVDRLFQYSRGVLRYRSLHFASTISSIDHYSRPTLVTNFPSDYSFTRIVDYSYVGKALGLQPSSAKIVTEYPGVYDPGSQFYSVPYYPCFTLDDRKQYACYHELLRSFKHLITVCGRLGSYKYLDMDDAIVAAMKIANSYLKDLQS